MKLERKNEHFTQKKLKELDTGDVFMLTLDTSPYLVYGDKDCQTRYLDIKDGNDVDMSPEENVFVCDAKLSYCVRSSLNGC